MKVLCAYDNDNDNNKMEKNKKRRIKKKSRECLPKVLVALLYFSLEREKAAA